MFNIYIIIENKKIKEANVWKIKYNNTDSLENKFFSLIIKTINDNKLISNPIHVFNHEFEEIVINLPKIKIIINQNFW